MNLGQTTPDLILNHNPDPELVKLALVGDKSPKLAHETYIDQKSEVYANESSVGSWLQTEVTRVYYVFPFYLQQLPLYPSKLITTYLAINIKQR